MEVTPSIAEAARALAKFQKVVALTGAGISVESGIPDFRSPGGLWTRYPPGQYATIQAFKRDPERVWRMLAEMDEVLDRAAPNPAHHALTELQRAGVLGGVITQNIDGLHQRAGTDEVVEFHGGHLTLSCLWCGESRHRDEIAGGPTPPRCSNGHVLKPDVVLFGEQIPDEAARRAQRLASTCRVMLVVGTSAEVAPASHMPMIAKRNGSLVIELNIERTLLSDSVTDIFVEGAAGATLPLIAREVKALLG